MPGTKRDMRWSRTVSNGGRQPDPDLHEAVSSTRLPVAVKSLSNEDEGELESAHDSDAHLETHFMFNVEYNYSVGTAGMFIALVALQQVWGVDFNTSVGRANKLMKGFIKAHAGKTFTLSTEDVVGLMTKLSPKGPARN